MSRKQTPKLKEYNVFYKFAPAEMEVQVLAKSEVDAAARVRKMLDDLGHEDATVAVGWEIRNEKTSQAKR